MDIKRNYDDNNKSTSSNFSCESNIENLNEFNSISNESDLLIEQFRLEHEIADQVSIKTQDSFITTYSTLEMILSQMKIKLASVFLEETEYLKQREQQLEQNQHLEKQRIQQLKNIQIEREQLEKEFIKLQNRLETAVVHVINFQTDGAEILRLLFSESHQIDEELSGIISESVGSLNRCRTMVHEKIDNFSQKSNQIQLELNHRETSIHHTQLSIKLMMELVNTLNQLNIEHSHDITMTITDFEKQHQQFIDTFETTKIHLDINKELTEVRSLENVKLQLEKELLEQTLLLENIYTIVGKAIIN